MSDYVLIMGGVLFNDLTRDDELIGLSKDEVNEKINDHIDSYEENQIFIFDYKPKKLKFNMVRTTIFDHVEIKD